MKGALNQSTSQVKKKKDNNKIFILIFYHIDSEINK